MTLLGDVDFNKTLGSGSFGSVYPSKNGTYAYKQYEDYDDECFGNTILSEVSMMKTLEDIPTIQNVDDVITKQDESGFFMKLYRTTVEAEVRNILSQKDYDNNTRINYAKHILYGLLVGLYYAHQRLIIHSDIKPSNIVINNERDMSIIDWGISIGDKYNEKNNWPTQTLWYRAPEVSLGDEHYSSKIDIWSAGLVCYFILTGKHLLPGDSDIDQLYKIFRLLGTPDETNWPGVSSLNEYKNFPKFTPQGLPATGNDALDDLLLHMLRINPIDRYTAAEALNHEFFNDLRNDIFVDIPMLERAMLVPILTINPNNINIGTRYEILSILKNFLENDSLNISSFFLAMEYADYILSQGYEMIENPTLTALACAYLAHMFNQYMEDADSYSIIDSYIGQFPSVNPSDLCQVSYQIFRYLGYNLYRQHIGLYFNIVSDDIRHNLVKEEVLKLILLFVQTPEYLMQNKLVVVAAAYYTLYPNIGFDDFNTDETIQLSKNYMSYLQ